MLSKSLTYIPRYKGEAEIFKFDTVNSAVKFTSGAAELLIDSFLQEKRSKMISAKKYFFIVWYLVPHSKLIDQIQSI